MRRNVASLMVYNLFRGFSTGGYMALFSAYMARQGFSVSEIGLAVSLSGIASAIASPLVGYLLEVRSSKSISVLTGLMLFASLLLMLPRPSLPLMTLSYSLFLISFFFSQPARMTYIARNVEREKLGSAVGLTASAFTAARTAGPPVAGYIAVSYGYGSSFSLLALSALLGALLFQLTSTEDKVERRGSYGILDSYKNTVKPPREVLPFYLFVVLDRAGWMLWFPMLSAYLVLAGLDEAVIGALYAGANLVEAVAMPLTGKVVDRLGAAFALAASELLAASAAISLALGVLGAPLSFLLMGLSLSFWIPGYNVYVARRYARMGEVFASTNAMRSLAGAPSSYVGGVLYNAVAPAAPLLLSSLMLVAAAALMLNMRENNS
ncbi:MAG: MFS transporter [Acidilobaceae archaeon]|nr:MFS transporter [Acidilobaceae archaeon]MCX8165455.1 MFS transporter [Acidilobaceae archaeon]MDW7973882.1 MFS transporter [Sulfolobales archaeon]